MVLMIHISVLLNSESLRRDSSSSKLTYGKEPFFHNGSPSSPEKSLKPYGSALSGTLYMCSSHPNIASEGKGQEEPIGD